MKATYIRLPGRHAGWLSRDSLWSADDHLLLVQSNGFTEHYRRYYYKDIQGFTVRPTRSSRRIAVGAGLPLVVTTALSFLALGRLIDATWAIVAGFVSLPLLVLVAANFLRGQSCSTLIHTAAGDAAMSPLSRERAAFRALQAIAVRVEAAQGPLDLARVGSGSEAQSAGAAQRQDPGASPSDVASAAGSAAAGSLASGSLASGSLASGSAAVSAADAPDDAALRHTSLLLLGQGSSEVLLASAGGVLLLFGPGTMRQIAIFAALALVLLASSLGLARGGKLLRIPCAVAMVHACVVGISWMLAVYIAALRSGMAQARGVTGPASEYLLDPSAPAINALLWFVTAGSLSVAIWCSTVHLASRRWG